MNNIFILIAILFPMLFGMALFAVKPKRRGREIYCMLVVCITTVIVIGLVLSGNTETISLVKLTSNISVAFKVDGISRLFAVLVSVLWPIATLWSFEYMYHEKRENTFFAFYTATYGITLGICFAANLVTMYLFYELLTLITVPLIMHSRNEFSKPAGIKYIAYSIAGATAAFAGIMLVYRMAGSFSYKEGGILSGVESPYIGLAFLLMFFGFGVKAAVFPLYDWLPSVGVAPTPVTALLHAVAVVKSGCFAIIRITYYIFGASVLRGTSAQSIALIFVSITIAFGSVWAYRETHFKRRLAMSTVSNLSYILLGAMLMTEGGLLGAMLHMLFHGVMKICLFFTAGTCHVQAHADYVTDLYGFGRKMPVTFGAFSIAALALIGIPPFCGFYSKFTLGVSAIKFGTVPSYLGMAALIVSAVFTALYLLTTVVNAFFPGKTFAYENLDNVKDPGWRMKLPFIILACLCLVLGLMSNQISSFVLNAIGGLC